MGFSKYFVKLRGGSEGKEEIEGKEWDKLWEERTEIEGEELSGRRRGKVEESGSELIFSCLVQVQFGPAKFFGFAW